MQDLVLLTKKVIVGLVVAVVPLTLLVGGLWLTRHALEQPAAQHSVAGKDGK